MSGYDKPVTRAKRPLVAKTIAEENWKWDPSPESQSSGSLPSAAQPLAETTAYQVSQQNAEEMLAAFYTKKEVEEGELAREALAKSVKRDKLAQIKPDWVTQAGAAASVGQGLKYDDKKEPLALLSRTWLLGVAQVMGFGAKKYAEHNWRNGHKRSRLISAALRHILAYNEGEDLDPESGLSHLDHASCCLQFAREGHESHPELDDRYKGAKK